MKKIIAVIMLFGIVCTAQARFPVPGDSVYIIGLMNEGTFS